MKGIKISRSGELEIESGKIKLTDNSDMQNIETLVKSNRGELKNIPQIGAEAVKMLGGSISSGVWGANLKKQAEACGIQISGVKIERTGEITIQL